MLTIEPFETHVVDYDNWFDRFDPAYRSELDAVGKVTPPGLVCEIGVGTGRFAAPLGIQLGIDPSPAMLKLARQRKIRVLLGQAEALPLAPGSFDGIVMVTTICFLQNVQTALREARRVLTSHGILVIGFLDKDTSLGRKYERRKNSSRFYGPARFWSTQELVSALQDTGFEVRQSLQTLFGPVESMNAKDPVRPGHGRGAFVVVAASPLAGYPG